jgi:hypothetical protein
MLLWSRSERMTEASGDVTIGDDTGS